MAMETIHIIRNHYDIDILSYDHYIMGFTIKIITIHHYGVHYYNAMNHH